MAQVQEGDTRKNPITGVIERYTPEGVWSPDANIVLSAGNLSPSADIPIAQPKNVPVPSVNALDATIPTFEMTQPEKDASSLSERLRKINESLIGESAFRAEEEEKAGIPALLKTQTDLSGRLKALQNEALQIPLQLQQESAGRGVTAGGLRPIETAALRNNAIQSLSISSLLEASKGNITLANDLVDRAVAAKYDPLKEELVAKTANLKLIIESPEFSIAEKNRAQAQLAAQNKRDAEIKKQEATEKEIYGIATTAAKYGADAETLRKIQASTDPIEALSVASSFLRDPKAKYELESMRLENILKSEQIETERKKRGLLGQPTLAEAQKAKAAKDAVRQAIPAAQEKLALIESLIKSPGLDSAVGPTGLGRVAIVDMFGAKQEFIGGVQQLVSQDTLDTLLNLKKGGGTLGALSDQERIMLQSAATKIGAWAIRDKDGNVTGYNVSESAMKTELERLQKLAAAALQRSQEGVFSPDEDAVLDQMFSGAEDVTDSSFSPDIYFN